jgi:hypothetical protein
VSSLYGSIFGVAEGCQGFVQMVTNNATCGHSGGFKHDNHGHSDGCTSNQRSREGFFHGGTIHGGSPNNPYNCHQHLVCVKLGHTSGHCFRTYGK